ncbi:unnamed protein product [Choristocarpus tenellus]
MIMISTILSQMEIYGHGQNMSHMQKGEIISGEGNSEFKGSRRNLSELKNQNKICLSSDLKYNTHQDDVSTVYIECYYQDFVKVVFPLYVRVCMYYVLSGNKKKRLYNPLVCSYGFFVTAHDLPLHQRRWM